MEYHQSRLVLRFMEYYDLGSVLVSRNCKDWIIRTNHLRVVVFYPVNNYSPLQKNILKGTIFNRRWNWWNMLGFRSHCWTSKQCWNYWSLTDSIEQSSNRHCLQVHIAIDNGLNPTKVRNFLEIIYHWLPVFWMIDTYLYVYKYLRLVQLQWYLDIYI